MFSCSDATSHECQSLSDKAFFFARRGEGVGGFFGRRPLSVILKSRTWAIEVGFVITILQFDFLFCFSFLNWIQVQLWKLQISRACLLQGTFKSSHIDV